MYASVWMLERVQNAYARRVREWDAAAFARIIFERRARQTELARRAGVSVQTLRSWLPPKGPSQDVLPKLAEELGVDPADLYRDDTPAPEPQVVQLPPDQMRLIAESIEHAQAIQQSMARSANLNVAMARAAGKGDPDLVRELTAELEAEAKRMEQIPPPQYPQADDQQDGPRRAS